MGRINVNLVEKVEELPNKIGLRKSVKVYSDRYRTYRHGSHYYRTIRQIIRGSVGKNWDKVVEHIKTKVPETYWHHIYNYPSKIVQHQNGYWYVQESDGDFVGYGRKNPSVVKNEGGWRYYKYYVDKQGVLKEFKGKSHIFRRYKPNKSEQRHIDTFERIVQHLIKVSDFYAVVRKDYWATNEKLSFTHPTKKQPRKRYNKETDSWDIIGYDPLTVSLTLSQFKLWCDLNDYKYIVKLESDGSYQTNMKWSMRETN